MDNPKELSPLPKGEVELGKPLPFAIYDQQGTLLLAAGQTIATSKQLDELSGKGLYHNPRWATPAYGKQALGTVKPEAGGVKTSYVKAQVEDPSETGINLRMIAQTGGEAFQVKLVGTYGREAFVVTHPMRDGKCVFVKEGQLWDFKSFFGLSMYKFTAMVDKVLLSPHPLLVMSWPQPQQFEARAVRTTRRVNCELPAVVRHPRLGEPCNGIIANMSTGGVEFKTPVNGPFEVGQVLSLSFQALLADRKFVLELQGKVVSLGVQAELRSLGISFVELDNTAFAAIHAYVYDRLTHRLGSPLYLPN
ncbi:PilZ domain-containing protein [Limnobacter sp.]|uniref:PilZ domain-containing protein n=1 Tax=Limnobacter sp. TaxID=2003368 RepID=UPI0035197663